MISRGGIFTLEQAVAGNPRELWPWLYALAALDSRLLEAKKRAGMSAER